MICIVINLYIMRLEVIMNIAELDITSTHDRFIRMYPIGDMHLEKFHFDEARFKRYIQEIAADPFGFWVFVGDAIEGRAPGQKLYDPDIIRPEYKNSDYMFQVQNKMAELFEPLRARPGLVSKGNHDEYQQWSGISQYLASISGAHYLGGEGMVRVNVDLRGKTRSILGYVRHIIGGGKRPGSKVNNAEDLSLVADADFYVAGHIHDSFARISSRFTLPRRGDLKLVQRPSAKIIAPSFLADRLQGFDDYAAKKGLPPTDNGIIVVDIDCENMRFFRREMRY